MLTTKDIITDDNDTNGSEIVPQPHVTHSDIDNTNDEASDSKNDDPIYANLPNISSGDSFDSSGSDKPKLVGILKSPGILKIILVVCNSSRICWNDHCAI